MLLLLLLLVNVDDAVLSVAAFPSTEVDDEAYPHNWKDLQEEVVLESVVVVACDHPNVVEDFLLRTAAA